MKLIIKILFLLILTICVITFSNDVCAHEVLIDTSVDLCQPSIGEDGVFETWYILSRLYKEKDSNGNYTGVEYYRDYHISHETLTIKYYFEFAAKTDKNYTWTTDVSEEEANNIKEAYANSMKKWNNIYFYRHNLDGTIFLKIEDLDAFYNGTLLFNNKKSELL